MYGRITVTTRRGHATGGIADESTLRDRHSVTFTSNGARGAGARRPSAPARGAARGARRHLAEGRLLAVGPVRLLHGAGRRQGQVVAASCRWPRSPGKSVVTLEGVPDDERDRYAQRVRRVRRAAVRLLHPRHRHAGQGADRQEGRRPRPRRHGPPPRRPPLPVHRLREDPRRDRGGRQGQAARRVELGAAVGASGVKYEARELALGDRGYVDDIRVPGMLHAALRLADHARATCAAIDTAAAPAAAGVVAVFTAADVPGELRVGIIHKDWPVFIPDGGRTSYPGDVLAVVVAETAPAGPRRGRARRGRLRRAAARSPTPVAAIDDPENAVWGTDGNVLSRERVRAGRRRRGAGRQRPRRARGVPDAAHRARLPRAGVDARRARARRRRRGRHAARVLRRPGRVGRPQRHRPRARRRARPRSPSSSCPTAARSAARRT